ncbi:MAG: chromosome segregation protein SMC, partial [Oscillospiraceae bacterium]|nr:chromosome segregation protein SMC [Oscillospiraceae bacterium]
MRLKALDLHGFKSFPDKTRLEFGAGITCVVGPNGAGKSNVSDAVRWVLGEQSTRQLRGAKMEDVIFSGTDRRRAQGLAEVTLHLDNSGLRLNGCDEKDVSVTRRLFRSGESDYLVNGKSVRLKDVHELFMDTGLGRDGYSLVGQGRVADLVSSHSVQRRDMLEEAAGISQSRYRRTAAQRKLEQAEENLVRLRDILLELEGRVEPLRQQKEKAERFLVLAEQRKKLEIGLALHTIANSTAALREQEHKITRAQAEYDQCAQTLLTMEAELGALTEQSQALTAQMEEIRLGCAAQEEQAVRQEGEILVLKNTLTHNAAAMERLEADRGRAADSRQQLEEEMDAALVQISSLRQEMAQKREQLLTHAKQAEQAQAEAATLQARTQQVQQATQARIEQLAQRQIAQSAAETAAAELRRRMETLAQTEDARTEQCAALQARLASEQEKLAAQREEAKSLENSLRGYQLRAENRSAKAQEAQRELERLQGNFAQKQARVRLLEGMEQNMEGYTGAVRAVMKEHSRGNLQGLQGTLSQLIRVEKEYAAAVETALGAALQFVVTQTDKEAKRAIEFLAHSKAGRATFLPMENIRGQALHEKGLEQCGGFVAMADELLACDARYGEIIRAQLGRTAVTEDLESALAIAKKYQHRFRVVTLDGQVVNAGGSLTGGSRAQGAGILSRATEIVALRGELKAQEGALAAHAQRCKQLAEDAAAVQAAAAGTQGDLIRALEDVIRTESQEDATRQRLADAQATLEALVREKDAAGQRVAQLEQARQMDGAQAAALEAEKQTL